MKPYPTYKPTGIEWLGDVPTHWRLVRAKNVFKPVDVRSVSGEEELLTVSAEHGVVPRKSVNVTMFEAASYVGSKLCWPGDLVINSLWAWGRGLGVSNRHGIVSSAYGVYRLLPGSETSPKYVHHLVRSTPFHWELQVRSKGIWISRLQLTDDAFLGSPFPLPPLPEQHAIARYLDYMDRRIQRYIRAKERLIELLEEQKRAVINQAVTRGLDPDVPLKPSGVEWLGDVPAHWEVSRLKFLSRHIQNGATPPTAEPRYYEDGTVPWYGPSSCNDQEDIGSPVRHLTADAFTERRARMIHGPALLIVVIGATAGRMALLTHEGSTNQQITSFELNTNLVNPSFVLKQVRGAEIWLRATASTATIPILDTDVVTSLPVALPPLAEQTAIVEYLNEPTTHTETGIARAHGLIKLVQEYRTRLIADVVTGKLDVRDAAAGLADDESDEAETDRVNTVDYAGTEA